MKISNKNIEFPLCIKNRIFRIKGINKLHIEFINGKYIKFNKTNLALQEPHKLIISNENEYIILLAYENDSNLYLDDLSNCITSTELKTIVDYMLGV